MMKFVWIYNIALYIILMMMINPAAAGVFDEGYIWTKCERFEMQVWPLPMRKIGDFFNTDCGYW